MTRSIAFEVCLLTDAFLYTSKQECCRKNTHRRINPHLSQKVRSMQTSDVLQQLHKGGLRPPKMLTLAITGDCNLECCHCWVEAGKASPHSHVPLDTSRQLIEEFAAMGGEGVRITGGEPLCHPEWLVLLKLLRQLRFKSVILQTNAMLLRDEHMSALRELDFPGFSIQISLDGVTPRTHDKVRGDGAHTASLHGITKLTQAGFGGRISIFFTEMRHNIAEIPDLLEFADSIGIGSVVTGTVVMCGRASKTSLVSPPYLEQYQSLLERYNSDASFREIYNRIGTVPALKWKLGDAIRPECCTFIENPYLTPSGRLYPCLLCHADAYSVTGVFEKGFASSLLEGISLWSELLRISRLRSAIIPECLSCSGKHYCAGGCMGRAWGSSGNFLSPDDRCEVRRSVY